MGFKMKGFSYPGKSPDQQRKRSEGPTARSNRIKADQEEDAKKIRYVDPVTGGNNAEYEREAGKLHAMFKTGEISGNELRDKKKALIARLRKKSPTKQKTVKLQPGENPDTYVYEGDNLQEKIIGLEDRIGFLKEDAFNQDGKLNKDQQAAMDSLTTRLKQFRALQKSQRGK